jgi:hypothetical protein
VGRQVGDSRSRQHRRTGPDTHRQTGRLSCPCTPNRPLECPGVLPKRKQHCHMRQAATLHRLTTAAMLNQEYPWFRNTLHVRVFVCVSPVEPVRSVPRPAWRALGPGRYGSWAGCRAASQGAAGGRAGGRGSRSRVMRWKTGAGRASKPVIFLHSKCRRHLGQTASRQPPPCDYPDTFKQTRQCITQPQCLHTAHDMNT